MNEFYGMVGGNLHLRQGSATLLDSGIVYFPLWLADDFDDFCARASKLAEESNGAPLFTVTQTHKKPVNHSDALGETGGVPEDDSLGVMSMNDAVGNAHEDDWQLL